MTPFCPCGLPDRSNIHLIHIDLAENEYIDSNLLLSKLLFLREIGNRWFLLMVTHSLLNSVLIICIIEQEDALNNNMMYPHTTYNKQT